MQYAGVYNITYFDVKTSEKVDIPQAKTKSVDNFKTHAEAYLDSFTDCFRIHGNVEVLDAGPVSYTHLTLPTSSTV